MTNYVWLDGKLKWIDGATRKWDCPHVSKCDVLVDTPEGMYEWNTDRSEPELPYRYVYLDELLNFIEYDVPPRPPFEYCKCPADTIESRINNE